MFTRVHPSQIFPQPYISESAVREYKGTVLANDNTITIQDDRWNYIFNGQEKILVILNNSILIEQNDYVINSNNTITLTNPVSTDSSYMILCGIVLSRLADTYQDDPHLIPLEYVNSNDGNDTLRFTLDTNSGDVFYATITKTTYVEINIGTGNRMALLILINGGSNTIVWPNNLRWIDGEPPSFTQEGVDYIYLTKFNIPTTFTHNDNIINDSYLLTAMVNKNLSWNKAVLDSLYPAS